MAAHRESVPLRQTSEVIQIEDGTMCRMPSPLPGPLRGESDVKLPDLILNLSHGNLQAGSGATSEGTTPLSAVRPAA